MPKKKPILGPINYLNSYFSSPTFEERYLSTNKGAHVSNLYNKQMKGFHKEASIYSPLVVPDSNMGSYAVGYGNNPQRNDDIKYYFDGKHTVFLDPVQAKKLNADLTSDVLPHEYSHNIRKLTPQEYSIITSQNINPQASSLLSNYNKVSNREQGFGDYVSQKTDNNHNLNPDENYSDLNALRYMMYARGYYDTRKGKIDLKTLNKALNDTYIKNQFATKRLLQSFTPQSLMNINNTVAYNNSQDPVPVAKSGISLNPYHKKFHNGEHVYWNSEAGHVQGTIKAIHTKPFQVSGKDGTKYTKHASKDNPVYEIKSNISDHIAYHFAGALHTHKFPNGGKVNNNSKPPFEQYYETIPSYKNDTSNYDLRAAYNNLPYKTMVEFATSPNGHLPDTYKLPNHPTFSNESIYFRPYPSVNPNIDSAGYWEGNMYIPYNPAVKDTIIDNSEHGGGEFIIKNGKKVPVEYMGGGKIENYNSDIMKNKKIDLSPIMENFPEAKSGIHINPKNKGKFNATKRRTGETTEELTHSKNPLTRKRAIFAQNASHWRKGDDGMPVNGSKYDYNFYSMQNGNLPVLGDNQMNINIPTQVDPTYGQQRIDRGNFTPKKDKIKIPLANMLIGSLSAIDHAIPNQQYKPLNILPQESTINPYGTESDVMANGGSIDIKKSHKGLFTKKAKKAGKSVQAYAKYVLSHKDKFDTTTIEEANFARNSTKFHKHPNGGDVSNDPPLTDQQLYNDYYNQFQEQKLKDPNRLAEVMVLSHKYGVPTTNVYTSTRHAYHSPQATYRDFTILGNDGKPLAQLRQPIAGDFAGAVDNVVNEPANITPITNTERIASVFEDGGELALAKHGMNFSSGANYHKWLGYIHSNHLAENTPGNTPVSIKGKSHNVKHAKNGTEIKPKKPSDNYQPSKFVQYAAKHPVLGVPVGVLNTIPFLGDQMISGAHEIYRGLTGQPESPSESPDVPYSKLSQYMINRHFGAVPANANLDVIVDNITPQEREQLPHFAGGGGLSRAQDYGSSKHPYPGVSSSDFAGPHRSYPDPTREDAEDALRLARLHHNEGVIANVHAKYPDLKANGGDIQGDQAMPLSIFSGGNAQTISTNPYSSPTVQFNGKSHADGGIKMQFGGAPAEVEGGETGVVDNTGNMNIMGNMTVPGTKMKFKSLSKKISKAENKANKQMSLADKVLNSSTTDNSKFGDLASNSAYLMGWGATQKQKKLSEQKQHLINIQNAMLDTAHEYGLDPQAMSNGIIKKDKSDASKGKYGKRMGKYPQGGRLPPEELNLLLKKFGTQESTNNYHATPSDPNSTGYGRYQFNKQTRDGIYNKYKKKFEAGFGIKNVSQFEKAFKNNPEVQDDTMALHLNYLYNKYDGNLRYVALAHRLGEPDADSLISKGYYSLNGKKHGWDDPISASTTGKETPLDYVQKILGLAQPVEITASRLTPMGTPFSNITTASNYNSGTAPNYNIPTHISPNVNAPEPNVHYVAIGNKGGTEDKYGSFTTFQPKPYETTPLPFSEIAPELFALGQNRLEGVQGQSFTPRLLEPYHVSMQDSINTNNADFNGLERIAENNPEYLSSLAAKKYEANNQVYGNQFKANQQIGNAVINSNNQILNNAALTNLKLGDQQYVRQAQATSNTKAENNLILNSIASKIAQNELENKQMAAYSSMFPYFNFDTNGNLGYTGPTSKETMQSIDSNPMAYNATKTATKSTNGALLKAFKNMQ